MAPIATADLRGPSDLEQLKAKVVVNHVEVEADHKVPVADNFMYDFKYNHPLPTTKLLGIEIPTDCDAQKEADALVQKLSQAMGAGNAEDFAALFLDYGKLLAVIQSSWLTWVRCLA